MERWATPLEIAFVGSSGSGKTTLLERITPALTRRGLRVGLVKHTHHYVEMDQEGRDSWRFAQAGAHRVLLVTPEKTFLQSASHLLEGEPLPAYLQGLDIVLHEGGRRLTLPTILVGANEMPSGERAVQGPLLALVGGSLQGPWPRFDRDDVEGIAEFLISQTKSAGTSDHVDFEAILRKSAADHGHSCPGQVLGVRMTLRALAELGIGHPVPRKRLMVIAETDRCAVDAVASVTGCSVGKRSLRLVEYGKMAATYVDLETGSAVRVVVRDDSRDAAQRFAEPGLEGHEAQASAYSRMSDDDLLSVQRVRVRPDHFEPPGTKRGRTPCAVCGEHVSDGRELVLAGIRLCRPCAGDSYYDLISSRLQAVGASGRSSRP